MDYKAAGVDIDAANRAKQMMAAAVRATHGPMVLAGMGAFGGAISLSETLSRYSDPVLVASTDGVGTKTLIAAALGRYDTVGQDLVNHCINDLLVQGARPLFFMDYIAAARLNAEHVAALVDGISLACREAGCALLGGETAEMPDVYAADAFDLAGTMVGVVSREGLITGATIKPGDAVLALPSSGLHTNGYSLARRVCEPLGYASRPVELGGQSLGEALLAIHRSYLLHIEALFATDVPIKGLAHITGGGLWENLPRVLPEGIGVEVRRGSWQISPLFRFLVERAGLNEYDAFRTFNMGLGMILILDAAEVATARSVVPELQVIGATMAVQAGERVRLV